MPHLVTSSLATGMQAPFIDFVRIMLTPHSVTHLTARSSAAISDSVYGEAGGHAVSRTRSACFSTNSMLASSLLPPVPPPVPPACTAAFRAAPVPPVLSISRTCAISLPVSPGPAVLPGRRKAVQLPGPSATAAAEPGVEVGGRGGSSRVWVMGLAVSGRLPGAPEPAVTEAAVPVVSLQHGDFNTVTT